MTEMTINFVTPAKGPTGTPLFGPPPKIAGSATATPAWAVTLGKAATGGPPTKAASSNENMGQTGTTTPKHPSPKRQRAEETPAE